MKNKIIILSTLLIPAGSAWGNCDFNSDGQLDSLDIEGQVNCILEQCPEDSQCDINGDGQLDIFDICATIDCIISGCWVGEDLSFLHSTIVFKDIPEGTFTMGESETDYLGPPGSYDAYIHTVTLSPFQMSETEVTNEQYVHFLNGAFLLGFIDVQIESDPGPNMGDLLVFGTALAPAEYSGMALYNLSGTRVMKDHDNADGDNGPFTGEIEPENPLNIAYIGFDELNTENQWFYIKDPANPADFNWLEITNYYNYTDVSHQEDTSALLNDYHDWEVFQDYPSNLPTLSEVNHWPATFIKWYGAKAFALFYDVTLPTEAQWEYAAQGGAGFIYATVDGNINGDGSSANWNYLVEHPSRGHVLNVQFNEPNPYGLYNMAGNVWEWIDDWYSSDYYINTDGSTDPVNTTNTGLKIRRGGSWNYHQATLKSAARAEDEQSKGNDHFGFRIVQNN